MIIFSFGITKAILSYKGQSIAPTTLELVAGTVLAAVLYWIGLYEAKKYKWLFQVDLAPLIGYCTKCFIGGALGVFFNTDGICIVLFLSTLPVIPFIYFSGVVLHVFIWVYSGRVAFGFTLLLLARRGRVRAQIWRRQGVIDFLSEYGPAATLAERYGRSARFGEVGMVAGLICGAALSVSPIVIFLNWGMSIFIYMYVAKSG